MRPGLVIDTLTPGSPEWLKRMSASKIAAVVGLSPFESPFSLWHRMAGTIPPDTGNDATRRGHYLEPGVTAWFRDQHPELIVDDVQETWQHATREWQVASPDALLYPDDHAEPQPVALLEVKTASDDSEWGQPGTDEIPPYYAAQVQWQMDTVGVDRAHVAVLLPRLRFAEYVVDYNPTDVAFLRGRAEEFLTSLALNRPPQGDGSDHTYEALRYLHPDITPAQFSKTDGWSGGVVELDLETARRFCDAHNAKKVAEKHADLWRNRMAELMGDAHRAIYAGQLIASRQSQAGGPPYVKAAPNLPTFTDDQEQAA